MECQQLLYDDINIALSVYVASYLQIVPKTLLFVLPTSDTIIYPLYVCMHN